MGFWSTLKFGPHNSDKLGFQLKSVRVDRQQGINSQPTKPPSANARSAEKRYIFSTALLETGILKDSAIELIARPSGGRDSKERIAGHLHVILFFS